MDPNEAAALFIAYGKVTGPASLLLDKRPPKPRGEDILKAMSKLQAAGIPYEQARDATITVLRWHGIPVPDHL